MATRLRYTIEVNVGVQAQHVDRFCDDHLVKVIKVEIARDRPKRKIKRRRLTDEEVLEVYQANLPLGELAEQYQCSFETVRRIKHRTGRFAEILAGK